MQGLNAKKLIGTMVTDDEDWYASIEQDFGLNARQESIIKSH